MNELLIVKLTVLSLCAVCKLVGELWWHNAQRFIMPLIIAVGVCLILHSFWIGLLVLPMIAPLCMGYSAYGKSDGFDRAVWLMLICVAEGLGLAITGHFNGINWLFIHISSGFIIYVPWCILAAIWGGVTRMWWNVIIAPISGLIIGAIVFLIR